MDFKYRTEYAGGNRSKCTECESLINQGTLRLAILMQDVKFDRKIPKWYHLNCFFKKLRPNSVDDIDNFEMLRLPDQRKIQEMIGVELIVPAKKGKKRTAQETVAVMSALKNFLIQYSKSSTMTCHGCELKIMKDEIRISKKNFDTELVTMYGGQHMWYHVFCFAKLRSELGYYESADKLPGFKGLNIKDQEEVNKQLPAINEEDIPDLKKIKNYHEVDAVSKKNKWEYTRQIKTIYKYRDQLQDVLSKDDLTTLLQTNNQFIPFGIDAILDHVADLMTCGSLPICATCKGNFVYSKLGYVCQGDLSKWTKCNRIEKDPKRLPFIVPSEFKKKHHLFKKYESKPCSRVLKDVKKAAPLKKGDEIDHKPKVKRDKPALYEMEFVVLGKTSKETVELKKQIVSMGGKVVTKIKNTTMAVISTEAEVKKMGTRIREAKVEQIQVISEDFLDEVKKNLGKIPDLIVNKSICNWGSDPTKRIPVGPTATYKSNNVSVPKMLKLKLKGGIAVDPCSGLVDCAHVYVEGQNIYSVVLGLTDIKANKNSFYKLQVLEADEGNTYWLFRSWGRIGTIIGGTKLEKSTQCDAKVGFQYFYYCKTGNHFGANVFEKRPGLMYPNDVEYAVSKMDIVIDSSKSKLPKPVEDLVDMIFDVKKMMELMMEFQLDMEKIPLGKISRTQVQMAYAVLTILQNMIRGGAENENDFIDASNRFYTLIPHSFGMNAIPVINTEEMVTQKLEMLGNLMELEIVSNLMKSFGSEHNVDSYYSQLNTEIEVLDHKTEEFKLISEYVKNTHTATHTDYTLIIENVFKIVRQGEYERYKPFKKLHNKKLLWHGSRRTNFAGILSQGLRIAPPEAPSTGYMFGKGIYFTDMVSKSANYCYTNWLDSKGLILLCEVALGNMYERNHAEYIETLPKNKHSTKGLGRTEPNPKHAKIVNDVEIPLGKGMQVLGREDSVLLYNEYIVYDVAQVNVKYLLKLDFKYKF